MYFPTLVTETSAALITTMDAQLFVTHARMEDTHW